MTSHERQDAANEIRLLASVRHPNIIRCAAHTISCLVCCAPAPIVVLFRLWLWLSLCQLLLSASRKPGCCALCDHRHRCKRGQSRS